LTGSRSTVRERWAIWLAILALGLNALVPIHLALDLSEAVGAAHHKTPAAAGHGLEWRLLALVAGHEPGDGKPDADHHHSTCAVFAALGALHGFATAAPPAVAAPALVEAAPELPATAGEPARAPAAAYRSRAPPRSRIS
jgi:hypothetical protein